MQHLKKSMNVNHINKLKNDMSIDAVNTFEKIQHPS